MARPTPTTPFQEELYTSLGPLADQDESQGWALLKYCGALASMFDQIETYVRDDPDDGAPGWTNVVDPDRAPGDAELAYIGNFVGVDLPTGLTTDQKRALIKGVSSFKRGTLNALVAAAQSKLIGDKTVLLRERDGGAYNLTVITYNSETPDTAAVLAALKSQKPAGIILTYTTTDGVTYFVLRTTYTDYTAVRSAFTTYNGLRNNAPGT